MPGDDDGGVRSPSAERGDNSENAPAFDGGLGGLLERNRIWSTLLPEGYFDEVQESQAPRAVSVCCSDSRVSQEGMFLAPLEAGTLFKPSNIGNKVMSIVEGERVVDGSFLYALANLSVPTAVVVGHTGCGAITAAYGIATGTDAEADAPPGIRQEVAPIVGIVEEALASGAIDTAAEESAVIDQLVEYNVNAQIEFLRESEEVADETDLYGFVYDFKRAYSDVAGRTILVNIDGETDPDALCETVPEGYEGFVGSLLR
jgi:carbonic anhydrase